MKASVASHALGQSHRQRVVIEFLLLRQTLDLPPHPAEYDVRV
jgi:hypothetical protein